MGSLSLNLSLILPVHGGPLAQLVEQLTLNQRAVGSTPTRPTKFFNHLQSAAQPVIPPWSDPLD